MNWDSIWLELFGATEWMGVDMGFWTALVVIALIVVAMNIVFWSMGPLENR